MGGQSQGTPIDLAPVRGERLDGAGVSHARELVAFTDAAMARDDDDLERARRALRQAIGDAAFVDACAVIAAFNVVDRIADATGIPLDEPIRMLSEDVRRELDLARFASSANTPGAR